MLFQSVNLRVERDSPTLATLWLDVRGQRFNVLNREVLDELDAAFQAVGKETDLEGLLLRSGKPSGFLAGADLNSFARIHDAEEARSLSATGQRVFGQFCCTLPDLVTVALLEGPCLGGGLELALACDYRIVVDRPDTQIGLPEVELGLLPAWGGTQRLPRVVGLENALKIILRQRKLNARESLDWELADEILAPEAVASVLTSLVTQLVEEGPVNPKRTDLPLLTWRQKLWESTSLGRLLLLNGTERILRRNVPDDMLAPLEALNAIRAGLKNGIEAGLTYEREAAGRLAESTAARNLINLFLQREAARKLPAELRDEPAQRVRRVGVVGAGVMGAGIVQLAALKGCEVVVQEVNDTALGAGMLRVARLFERAVAKGRVTADEARQRLAAVRGTTAWKGFEEVDLVVEAATEDLALKQRLFRELDALTPPNVVLATNTSALPVAAVQKGLKAGGRIAALHFFNPVHRMPLVEIGFTPLTEHHALATLLGWTITLGKTPILVKDSPGFVVNRVLAPYLHEAILLVGEGMSAAEIDRTMRRAGMPMGPLELLDQVGIGLALHVEQALQPVLGERLVPHPGFARLAERLAQPGVADRFAFYLGDRRSRQLNRAAVEKIRQAFTGTTAVPAASLPSPARIAQARERMLLLMVNEAAACLGEGLVTGPQVIDLAMVLGTGWAPHRGGPLHFADQRGIGEVVRVLDSLAQQLGPRFVPCAELAERTKSGQPFFGQEV